MTTKEDRALARKALAGQAGESYGQGHTLVEVADELGCSYGKAHALVKESGVSIRPRGARFTPPGSESAPADAG